MDEPATPLAVERPTARVLLIDGRDRVLLFEMHTADGRVFWCPPGGGLEAGESHEQAALRELTEETGWRDPMIGPLIGGALIDGRAPAWILDRKSTRLNSSH